MKKILNHTIAIIAAIILFTGCSEDYLKEEPPHIITTVTLYTSYNGFQSGLNGLYSLVRQDYEGRDGSNYLRKEMWMNGNDNMTSNHRDGFARVAESWPNNNSTYIEIRSNFYWLYQIINSANTIIIHSEDADVDWTGGNRSPEENKNSVQAHAKAIRAWAYRYLTYGWGDVPLNLNEALGSEVKTDWERTPVAEVRAQIIEDLLFAELHIGIEPENQGRITKGAIQHYLSEMYLVENNPAKALEWANKCINTPAYALITNRYGAKSSQPGVPFMDMFYNGNSNRNEGNTEALWVFPYEFEVIGGSGAIMRRWHVSRYEAARFAGRNNVLKKTAERGGRGLGRMSLTKWAIDNYEVQDDRASNYAIRKFFILKTSDENAGAGADVLPTGYKYGDTVWMDWSNDITFSSLNRTNWPYSRKWDSGYESFVDDPFQYNDLIYLRLAETYLLKAEAQLALNDQNGAAATLNIIRERSKATPIAAGDVDIDFILDERSRELLAEEQRRITLLRTGKWLERVRKYNKNGGQTVRDIDVLFAIPQDVIDANLTLQMENNPGH
jgi:starch-binding outer membrane protein, SusD/RagB family